MALVEEMGVPETGSKRRGDVVLGDDWVAPDGTVEQELQDSRARRGLFSLRTSPLTRKIIMFNLIALNVLVGGILYLNSSRDGLAAQRASGLVSEAELIADVFEAQLPGSAPVSLVTGDGVDVAATLEGIELRRGAEVFVFDPAQAIVGRSASDSIDAPEDEGNTVITDLLGSIWDAVARLVTDSEEERLAAFEEHLIDLAGPALAGNTTVRTTESADGGTVFTVGTPIEQGGAPIGAIVLVSASGEIDKLVRTERERVLQMFLVATLVSIGLSLVLASTISNPISDLAEAAELGRDRDRRKDAKGRIRIPDLTARPDEIGRLSGALRGMVTALYDRIDANEQFAADVSHEIKNPLTSIRSALETLPLVKTDEQRARLTNLLQQDVRRLDRLITDISNASRLDAELSRDRPRAIDLKELLGDIIGVYEAGQKPGEPPVRFVSTADSARVIGRDIPLGQVFRNLIDNARSFSPPDGEVRVSLERDDSQPDLPLRVRVEDDGPGIPADNLETVFERFYTSRPKGTAFGANSGLGLAIVRQIIDAHGGHVHAENRTGPDGAVVGARFEVRLPATGKRP